MSSKKKCSVIESQLLEYFSNPSDEIPAEIQQHLASCKLCNSEFENMSKAMTIIKEASIESIEVPDYLLNNIETMLDNTEQAMVHNPVSSGTRNRLMIEYTYISILAISVWLTLALGQPMAIAWLSTNGFELSEPILREYGLFILFFLIGGFTALISSPLLIRQEKNKLSESERPTAFKRFFSSYLNLFVC